MSSRSLILARNFLRRLPQWNSHVSTTTINRRSMVSATPILLEQKTMKLPGLGDSITEGTIVEWTAAVGQAVQEGDVVAMVETDKVTVDIKAEASGVVMEQFAGVDDTVEVGADLYKLDTEAEASVSAASGEAPAAPAASSDSGSAPPPPPKEEPKAATKETTTTTSSSSSSSSSSTSHSRTPSIQFLGKAGWEKAKAGTPTPTVYQIPPNYGRPVFTEEEMDALVMGGANIAPQVKQFSSGAMFG